MFGGCSEGLEASLFMFQVWAEMLKESVPDDNVVEFLDGWLECNWSRFVGGEVVFLFREGNYDRMCVSRWNTLGDVHEVEEGPNQVRC